MAIGGTIGFFLNAAGPFRDGAWLKLARAATWGTLAGAAGGAIGLVLGEFVLGRFQGGLIGRAVSWAVLGLGIGVSQGLADRSLQRLVYGVIGGRARRARSAATCSRRSGRGLGNRYDLSRQGLGIVILGAGLGLFLALVEQVLRRAWVQVLRGPAGRACVPARRGRTRRSASTNAPRSAFSATRPSPAATPTSSRPPRAVLLLRASHRAGGPRSTGRSSSATPRRSDDGDRIELGQTLLVFRQR